MRSEHIIKIYDKELDRLNKLLLEMGADLESKDHHGHTALERAEGNGHKAVVKLLRGEITERFSIKWPGQLLSLLNSFTSCNMQTSFSALQ